MTKLAHKMTLLTVLVTAISALASAINPVAAQSNTTISWFMGKISASGNTDQINAEKKVAQEFNETVGKQNHITLQLVLSTNTLPTGDELTIMLRSGNAPDIAGPLGVTDSNSFSDQWLDLKPLMENHHYDLRGFEPTLFNLFETLNGGYSAIPFVLYPSVVYYNRTLFDAAGLKYPPDKADAKYTMPDGSQVDWNYQTLAQIAKLLTIDQNGNNAVSDKFDPEHIIQYGLDFQWDEPRLMLSYLLPSPFFDPATNKVKFSNDWRTGAQWLWNAVWKYHFIPDETASGLGYVSTSRMTFASGQVAMNITPLWITSYINEENMNLRWNIAFVPESLDGKTHVPTDADLPHPQDHEKPRRSFHCPELPPGRCRPGAGPHVPRIPGA